MQIINNNNINNCGYWIGAIVSDNTKFHFRVLSRPDFDEGIWQSGIWYDGDFWNGIWCDGQWHNGIWHKGTWLNGHWHDGKIKKGGGWKYIIPNSSPKCYYKPKLTLSLNYAIYK